jgi:hypothetical protein
MRSNRSAGDIYFGSGLRMAFFLHLMKLAALAYLGKNHARDLPLGM